MASPYPHNGVIADLAHAQQGVVGYVHPFDTVPDPAKDPVLSHQLPADVAHGKVDYLEVVGFADHKATAEVWYRLLNLGFRLPAGAGTDAMANYASLRGPVGMNRVFLDTRRTSATAASLLAALKAGRGFASNGAAARAAAVDGQQARRHGRAVRAGQASLPHRAALAGGGRSPRAGPQRQRGQALRPRRRPPQLRRARARWSWPQGGWLLLRAWNDGADPQVLDLYPYATTNPVWLELPGGAPPAREDAAYFVAWIERVIEAADARDDYNDAEREARDARLPARGAGHLSRQGRGELTDADAHAAGRCCALLRPLWLPAPRPRRRRFGVDDLARLADVAEPDAVAGWRRAGLQRVSTANRAEDKTQSRPVARRLRRRGRVQLTEHAEAQRIASAVVAGWRVDRLPVRCAGAAQGEPARAASDEEDEEISQVWLMPAAGGKARRLTTFASGVDDYVWSPDGKRLAVIVRDPERPAGAPQAEEPAADRHRRATSSRKTASATSITAARTCTSSTSPAASAEQITPGDHDELLPAWSPDGKLIAYVTKRGVDPDRHLNFDIYVVEPKAGAQERQLTTFTGSDLDPYWETRPAWSPDSTRIAYLRAARTSGSTTRRGSWPSSMSPPVQSPHRRADRPLLHQAALGAGRQAASTRWSSAAASPICRASTSTAAR